MTDPIIRIDGKDIEEIAKELDASHELIMRLTEKLERATSALLAGKVREDDLRTRVASLSEIAMQTEQRRAQIEDVLRVSQELVASYRDERDALRAREELLFEGVLSFGWAIVDPWTATRGVGFVTVTDAGPVCPVCGQAAPKPLDGEDWPRGGTMRDPTNHGDDCALVAYLRKAT